MTSNLFGQPSKNDIKVGYIDPQLGYVSNVTICEANEYAEKNPGTTFLFKDGNRVLRYLNIREVNNLTIEDLNTNKECEGINQKEICGPPVIQFYGGGGIGALGNPVIGSDGAILAVDLIRGGNGYEYPPQVSANDHCNYGAGAVLTAVLGETADQVETYDDEEEFEEYEICDPNDAGFGRKYGPNGEDLGPWEPSNYTRIGGDPIKLEIDEYERIIRLTERKPFWSTRNNKPNKITASDPRVTLTQSYDVTDKTHLDLRIQNGEKDPKAWNEFMNSYAISPVSPSNVKGSDYAGILFTFEWNQEFPTDGEYIFRGLCDNISQLYLDNEKVADLGSFASPVVDIKKTISKGIHNVRVDLLNVPVVENIVTTVSQTSSSSNDIKPRFIEKSGKYFLEVTGIGSGEVSFVMDVNDAFYIAGLAATEIIIPSDNKKLKFTRKGVAGLFGKGSTYYEKEETIKDSGKFTAGKTYGPIEIIGASAGVGKPRVSNNKLGLLDTEGTDENIKLIIDKVTNNPNSTTTSTTSTSSTTASVKTTNIFNTIDYIDKADRKLWRINPTAGPNSDFLTQYGVCPFDTTTKKADTNSFAGTHVIRWQSINFPVDGNYNIDIMVDDNVTLYIGNSSTGGKIDDGSGLGKDEIVIKKKGYSSPGKSTGKTTESRYFKAGNYRIRAELEQIDGKPLSKGNPMALAINISVSTGNTPVVSSKSWNENPMGVSLTIDAPEPPVPQEQPPEQEGRCPNNPLWSTRFPTTGESWYPVNYPGPRKVTETITDFVSEPTSDKQEVEFTVYGQGAFQDIFFTFTSTDGQDSFIIRGVDKNKKTRSEKIKILKNVPYVVKAKEDSVKYTSVEQGLIKGGTKDKESGTGTSNKIFADYVTSGNDNDDIQVTCSLGTFTSSNRRKAKNSSRNTFDLTYKLEAAPTVKNTAVTSTRTYDAPGWSRFMNRYAISPVKPLDIPGSDKSGVTYTRNWDVDIPYDGFYGVKGTRDNLGKILIDGKEVSSLDNFSEESPKLTKIFLTKGKHKITAEVYNQPVTSTSSIDQKIFRTKDWQVGGATNTSSSSAIQAKFIEKNGRYFVEVTGTGSGEVSFVMDVDDAPYIAGIAASKIVISSDSKKLEFARKGFQGFGPTTYYEKETIKNSGKFTAGKTYSVEIIGAVIGAGTPKVSSNKIGLLDAEGKDENIKLTISNVENSQSSSLVSSGYLLTGEVRDGVTYEGPAIFHYNDSRWGEFMNNDSISPYTPYPNLPALDKNNSTINGTKKYTWRNVKFPESGQYKIAFKADNIGNLYIGGTKVLTTSDFLGPASFEEVNITQGTYDIVVEVENIQDITDIFINNPTGFSISIFKTVTLTTSSEISWSQNPMGISAILVPPPCPKKISGRGVVKEVKVQDPGSGYTPSGTPSTYPVLLRLKSIDVEDPGINYKGDEVIEITTTGGTFKIPPTFGPFGTIPEVPNIPTITGITEYPTIQVVTPNGETPTGINASFRPQFEIIRDPIVIDQAKLIQVTDLVGLKQNGYVDGRAYYGAVFYKDGVRYAGFYETPGELVQVYDTLQESIEATVTTRPSAIERSGTDTELSSNNPKLNIPNTPENLI